MDILPSQVDKQRRGGGRAAAAYCRTVPLDDIDSLACETVRVRGNIICHECAQQYVGKSQSCMVISSRLYCHAPVVVVGIVLAVCGRTIAPEVDATKASRLCGRQAAQRMREI